MKTLPNFDANNPLILGTALHTGIEEGLDAALKFYENSFPCLNDENINEIIKLVYLIPEAQKTLPKGIYELPIASKDFIGYADMLVPIEQKDGIKICDLYDFKYSSNQKSYLESGQLHEYKYFLEETHKDLKIRNMYFVFIPKVSIRQKKDESLLDFRDRIQAQLQESEIKIVPIEFKYNKAVDFALKCKRILETEEFPKEESYLCSWCEYQEYCESERMVDYMILPENKRRNIESINKKVVWLYGSPFSGKTYLANQFPDPLMLNTDGNIRFVDAPYISIKDEVKVVGRHTERTLAWQIFKDAIEELEKKENSFKTIVVDLLEDMYEHCRIYMYDKLNITHESDDPFSAWDKVRTEFLSTMKRLMNLDYENIILISHEDRSKDITKRSGDKITSIKPNLQDKVANKIAGMVDIVARVVAEGDERTLSFKTNEVIFGGGRITVEQKEIPLDYESFMAVYEEANKGKKKAARAEVAKVDKGTGAIVGATPEEMKAEEEKPDSGSLEDDVQEAEEPVMNAPEVPSAAEKVQEAEQEEKPKTRTRRKRGE